MDTQLLIGLGVLTLILGVFIIDLRSRRSHVADKRRKSVTPVSVKTGDQTAQIDPSAVKTTVDVSAVGETVETPPAAEQPSSPPANLVSEEDLATNEAVASTETLFARMVSGLNRTRGQLSGGLGDLLLGKKEINEDLLEEIETQLLTADIGISACRQLITTITEQSERNELKDSDAIYALLKAELSGLLANSQSTLQIDTDKAPYVILVVGVNGVGKTTTIGKMAKRFQNQGHSVMLAAGDTFRAAAVEQLQVWGERNNVPVVAQHTGADSASVIYDAVESAKSKGIDIVIADTAGRLQNKDNLMGELEKVVRVMQKIDASAPHEVMLVLDAGTGQNALNQADTFQQAVGVTGISLTKLDGTAKGGIIFAIAKQLSLPIRFIGVGEQIDDLRPFEANEFIDALFDDHADK
jgi:fused signal recognition particle receptor